MHFLYEYENYDPSFPDQPVVDLYLPLLGPLERGDTVLLLCSPGLDLVEVIFACQRAGLLSVPLIPPHPSFANENYHHLIRAISQTKPKAAVAHSHYISSIQHYLSSPPNNNKLSHMLQSIRWISIDQLKHGKDNAPSLTYSGCKADDVYLVQYTSGATGVPKPVLVTAGSAAHNVRTARKAYDLHPNSTIVSWLPQYHDCGLMFLLLTIVSGATCVLTSPTNFIKRPSLWLELISQFKATCTPVPSFTLPLVLNRGQGTSPINLSTLNNLIIINEPIYRDSVEQFLHAFSPHGLSPSSISPSYGLAENCTFVSTAWRSDNTANAYSTFLDFPTHNKLLPVARLRHVEQEDVEIMVVDEQTLEPAEDGVEGEIWVASPSNASGYLGHPSLTREVFHGRLRNTVSRCFLRTGDRGIVKGERRYLFVTGRCQDVIKLQNGDKVHPHYVETAAYNSCTKLLRGGCVAAFNVSSTVALVAEMQRVGKDVDKGSLRRVCEGIREGVWKKERVEVGWVVLARSESVPKTTSGKLQRWHAKEKLLAGQMMILMEMRFGKDVTVFKRAQTVRDVTSSLCAQTRTSLISHL
uniref:Fatty-acid--CoA ligase fadD26 n=1 Tax=Cajanus cajan TaxID=3821 RepID=A0A151TC11_CAJCA|nr:Putative fatty-acid--CoA ligase fadD26 [Cajanus cajan]